MENNESVWGVSKLDNEGSYPKTFKIKQGKASDEQTHNVFRILPAMKDQRRTGKIAGFHRVHYGYYVANPRFPGDPTKALSKSFVCIEESDYQTKMISVPCAECNLIKAKKEEYADTEASFDVQAKDRIKAMQTAGAKQTDLMAAVGKIAKEKEALLAPLKEWLRVHNLEKKWHVNVKNTEANSFGDIHISNRLWVEIRTMLKDLETQWRCSPLSPDKGVLVDIVRTGNGSGVTPGSTAQDKPHFVTEFIDPANPAAGSKIKLAPLTADDAERVKTGCRDVFDPSPALVLSADVIKMLTNCDESHEEVARILKLRTTEPGATSTNRNEDPAPVKETEEDVNAALEAALAAGSVVVDEEDGSPRVKATGVKGIVNQGSAWPPPSQAFSTSALANMSTEDFMNKFEDPEARK